VVVVDDGGLSALNRYIKRYVNADPVESCVAEVDDGSESLRRA